MNSSQQIQSNSGNININGYLVDENPDVEGLSVEINNSSTYTVPSAKRLYITHAYGVNADLIISGVGTIAYSPGSDHVFSMPIIINAGQQIQSNSGNININGYLVDETFFQNCQ
jgi:hypothetical protein